MSAWTEVPPIAARHEGWLACSNVGVSSGDQFSAKATALGYAYQFRYALLTALRRQQGGLGWTIALEAVDDIEVEGLARGDGELLQLKHRAAGTVLSDGSVDLWKTLRVWSVAVDRGVLIPTDATLLLVTTSSVAPGTVCEALSAEPAGRDNAVLAGRLEATARTSKNNALLSAHEAFLKLSEVQRADLLSAVRIVQGAPDIEEVDDQIRSLARLAVRPSQVESFVSRLEGWWNRRCLRQLTGSLPAAVHGNEFDGEFSALREQFHHDSLPIDHDVADVQVETDSYRDRIFIRQLDLAGVGGRRLLSAVRDYHRAFVQRSRWSEEGLLDYGELDRYERRLHESWQIIFERTREELGDQATDDLQVRAAKAVYAWAEDADIPIRPACGEGFISRGSLHLLADCMRVGWHPEFELRLARLIEQPTSS